MRSCLIGIVLLITIAGIGGADEITVQPGQSIQNAINIAAEGDTVTIISGPKPYVENVTWTGKNLLVRGHPALSKPIVVPDDRTEPVITCRNLDDTSTLESVKLQGGGKTGTAFHSAVLDSNADLKFSKVEITGFRKSRSEGGGGAYVKDSSPEFDNCLFENNSSSTMGGAIYASGSLLTMADTEFNENFALDGGGVALVQEYLDFVEDEELVAEDCTFSGNYATAFGSSHGGGAVYAAGRFLINQYYEVKSSYDRCRFEDNWAQGSGGALFLFACTAEIDRNSVFLTNEAVKAWGGAVYVSGRPITIRNSRFEGNTALGVGMTGCPGSSRGYGGAISFVANAQDDGDPGWGPIEIIDCTILDNHAVYGGGIQIGKLGMENSALRMSEILIERNLITDNSAMLIGGGIYRLLHVGEGTTDKQHRITNNTILRNSANPRVPYGMGGRSFGGGGVFLYGVTIETILEDNEIAYNTTTGNGAGIMTEDNNSLIWGNNIHDNDAALVANVDTLIAACEDCPSTYSCTDGWAWYDTTRYLSGRGGGIGSTGSGGLEIVGNRIVGNSAAGTLLGAGGGISMRLQPTELVTIRNNLVADNNGGHEGGGVHVEYWPWAWLEYPEEIDDATIDVLNNAIVGNESVDGGGIFIQDETQEGRTSNNILTCNTATGDGGGISAPSDSTITPSRYAYNDLYDNTAGGSGDNWGGPFDPVTQATYHNISLDPEFFGFEDCLGSYSDICDFRLSNDSPCHHAGDPRSEDENCDGSRNDQGMFGGPGLCEDLPCDIAWIVNLVSGTGPDCYIGFTWNTMRDATSQLGYKITSEEEYTWLTSTSGTSHQASFTYEHMAPYDVKVIATLNNGEGLSTEVDRNFRYPCYTGGRLVVNVNPFNPKTDITFRTTMRTSVSLAVFDIQGRRVRTLVDGVVESGEHAVDWDGRSDGGDALASGVYYVRLTAEGETFVKTLTLLK